MPYNADGAAMVHHPAIQKRKVVVVGDYNEARSWVERHAVDLRRVVFATAARQIRELPPTRIHLVVMPSVRNWRHPYHFMLRTELNFMHAKGATLEWA